MSKVLFVIDSQNLFYALRDKVGDKNGRLDFLKLREIVCRKTQCSFIHAIVYFSVLKEDLSQLQDFLVCNGFEVPQPVYNRDVDSRIIVDTLKYAGDYDIVVLASGDADFIPLMVDLREKNKLVGVIAFDGSISSQLETNVDWTIRLDNRILLDKR